MARTPLPPEQCRFGSHMSIAGGLPLAFERGVKVGCDVMQVFVKNQRQWQARPLQNEEVRAWEAARKTAGIGPVIAHDTYLINLAAPDDLIWKKSIAAFTDELQRCEQLGIIGLVTHPGSHCGQGEDWGIRRIVKALDLVLKSTRGFRTSVLLEVTAGQGSAIGHRFEHLAAIMAGVRRPERLALCLDTCHLFAAGYSIDTPEGYADTVDELERIIGPDRVMCIHVNDSLKPRGSRVDRHAHIGKGLMTLAAFRHFINDPRFFDVPMILETEKGRDARGRDWDRVNLATLRRLVRR